MDRMEEYRLLLDELEQTPSGLESALPRARARYRRRRLSRWIAAPAGSVAAMFAVFVLLVNLVTPFALACSNIPILKELTAAVAFSPSLKASIEHEYVQRVAQSQTDGDVTMKVEYLIVDQKQVNVFFSLSSDRYSQLDGSGDIRMADGQQAHASLSFPQTPSDPKELRRISIDFQEEDVPDTLILDYKVWAADDTEAAVPSEDSGLWNDPPADPDAVAIFSFTLQFDPNFTSQGSQITLDQTFILDGQQLKVVGLEIYPTHVRVDIQEDEANTVQINSLTCWLEDDKGVRYDRPQGLIAHGDGGTPRVTSYRFESSYFEDAQHLTLHIEGAIWQDKEEHWVTVDLTTGRTDPLPDGITLARIEEIDGIPTLTFRAPTLADGMVFRQVVGPIYRAPDGSEHHFSMASHTIARDEDGTELEGIFEESVPLKDYLFDQVELEILDYHTSTLDTPITLTLN